MTTNLDTISIDQLETVTGGYKVPAGGGGGGGNPQPQQKPINDFAHNYANRLRQDTNNMYQRRVATGNALKNHDWGGAARNAAGYVVDGIHGAFDLVNFT